MNKSTVGMVGLIVIASSLFSSATAYSQTEQKLLASDGAFEHNFGTAVSIDGDRLVVGAVRAGSAYVFRFDGTSWIEEQKLLQSDGAAHDFFGESVSISGNRVVVGTPYDDDKGDRSGSAYVFDLDGASGDHKLLPNDGAAGDRFGKSVSIAGDRVVVGAPFDGDNGSDSGSAYVFRFDGASWIEEQKLLASDGATDDTFGETLSIDGDRIVVGARLNDDNGDNTGSAYVFRFDGASWTEEQKLTASDGAAGDFFGSSVSIDGDRVIVGAFGIAVGEEFWQDKAGGVYVFSFDGTSWKERQTLLATDRFGQDHFGNSLLIAGDVLIVGARLNDDNGDESGSAYIFRFDGASWNEDQKLLPSDGATGDEFGKSVSMDGDRVVVGAPHNDDNADDAGSAYIYDLRSGTNVEAVEDDLRPALRQHYPNPFAETTTIRYALSRPADVTLTVVDVLGRKVRELVSGTKPAGTYEVSFDATALPSGIYFYRLQAGDYVETKRMAVVR